MPNYMDPDVNELTRRERDCLIAVVENLDSRFPIKLVTLSRILGGKPPTILEIVRRLQRKDLLIDNSGMILPTEKGYETCSRILEAHRILECLVARGKKSKDEACREVSDYDYLVSHKTIHEVWALLGNPQKCPHGKAIEIEQP
jgi:DtxR family Mn-dependent transcriptional regulator